MSVEVDSGYEPDAIDILLLVVAQAICVGAAAIFGTVAVGVQGWGVLYWLFTFGMVASALFAVGIFVIVVLDSIRFMRGG